MSSTYVRGLPMMAGKLHIPKVIVPGDSMQKSATIPLLQETYGCTDTVHQK